jgi:hypothetical protein
MAINGGSPGGRATVSAAHSPTNVATSPLFAAAASRLCHCSIAAISTALREPGAS